MDVFLNLDQIGINDFEAQQKRGRYKPYIKPKQFRQGLPPINPVLNVAKALNQSRMQRQHSQTNQPYLYSRTEQKMNQMNYQSRPDSRSQLNGMKIQNREGYNQFLPSTYNNKNRFKVQNNYSYNQDNSYDNNYFNHNNSDNLNNYDPEQMEQQLRNLQIQKQIEKELLELDYKNEDMSINPNVNDKSIIKSNEKAFPEKSPLGMPVIPFHHTRNTAKRNGLNEIENNFVPQTKYIANNSGNNIPPHDYRQSPARLSMINEEDRDVIGKYDQRISDISNTLAQLRQYKQQLNQMQQQSDRAKSSSSNLSFNQKINRFPQKKNSLQLPSNYGYDHKMPMKQNYNQETPKNINKGIFNDITQQKLSGLMAINIYNKALQKKEQNDNKIAEVITKQNEMLQRMLFDYDQRSNAFERRMQQNFDDTNEQLKFEQEKQRFQNAYSNLQNCKYYLPRFIHYSQFRKKIFYLSSISSKISLIQIQKQQFDDDINQFYKIQKYIFQFK